MSADTLGIGMAGYGFIARVHTWAYRSMPLIYDKVPLRVELVGACTATEKSGLRAVEQAGYAFHTRELDELVARDDIDIIHCCLPNHLHKPCAIKAAEAGKHLYCDKPLALNLNEARDIWDAVKGARVVHQMAHEYRFIPAIMRAKQLVDEGFLGRVFGFRACYLHSGYVDPQRPMSWRLDKNQSGAGALYDLGAHVIDLILHLIGDCRRAFATTRTFIDERPASRGSSDMRKVDVDDVTVAQLEMENGGLGTVEVSRLATGANDELRLEVHGSEGAIAFNLMEPNWLYVYDSRDASEPIGGMRGFKRIETVQRYPEPASLPGPKFAIGWLRYHVASQFEFLRNVAAGNVGSPSVYDGLKVQAVMEACLLSAQSRSWEEVERLPEVSD